MANADPLWFYYAPTPTVTNVIDTSNLVTTGAFSTYGSLVNASFSNQQSQTNLLGLATASNTSNIVVLLSRVGTKLDDDSILGDIIGGIVNAGTETLGDYIGYLLKNNDTLRDGFNRLVDDFLGDVLGNNDGGNFTGDANNPALNSNTPQADFRYLKKNPFAVDRASTYDLNYGVTLAGKDFCLTPSANICFLSDSHVYTGGPYGLQYANTMTTTAKQVLFNTSTLTWTASNAVMNTSVRTPTFFGSNVYSSNVYSTATVVSPAAAVVTPAFSNTSTSNLLVTANSTVQGNATVNGAVTANSLGVNSWTVGPSFTPYASVDASGNMTSYSLTVNGNSFVVTSDGSVSVNGTQIVDGPNKTVVIYDDQIKQRTQRNSVSQVAAGNLGTEDTQMFMSQAFPQYTPQQTANPMSFTSLANRANQGALRNSFLTDRTYDPNSWWNI